MKKIKKAEDQPKKTTTNYPMDSHKDFCRRCFARHGGCPNRGGPKACSL